MVEFNIFRYDPDKGGEPYFKNYKFEPEKGMTVLEGLIYINENLDPSLAYRASCREAVCGSCAMHINDMYRLACKTQISVMGDKITLRPLSHLPILKDLVADLGPFFEHFNEIKPYFIPKETPPQKEYIQSIEQRKRIDAWLDCILCGACYGSCPVAGKDENYLGPHALLKALRFVDDSRDGGAKERIAVVARENGVFRCHTVFNCQKVCPKDLDPSGAIARLKMKTVFKKF